MAHPLVQLGKLNVIHGNIGIRVWGKMTSLAEVQPDQLQEAKAKSAKENTNIAAISFIKRSVFFIKFSL